MIPTIFALHYLGGSAREWTHVSASLDEARLVGIDLPGFGDAAETAGYGVEDMAAYVAGLVRAQAPERWLLAGHSMGAKVAAVVARQIEDGSLDIPGFAGLVLLAGSPPSPEPMADDQRKKMLARFSGDAQSRRDDARAYVAENAGNALDPAWADRAADDALRMIRDAWVAWLERGSREDWDDRVGTLQTPALVMAGDDDPALGPDAQRTLMLPHFANARLATFPATKHLLPLERPREVARAIDEHVRRCAYGAVLASPRVGGATRSALLARTKPDDPHDQPKAMTPDHLETLRALVARIVPQTTATPIDLAARIDAQLSDGPGDGWRFASLPDDAAAYRSGLETLEAMARAGGGSFAELDPGAQDELLTMVSAGAAPELTAKAGASPLLGPDQMQRWFEDVRADAAGIYVAHPDTLARLGYSGDACGGDGNPKTGFARIGPGEREAWEPVAEGRA